MSSIWIFLGSFLLAWRVLFRGSFYVFPCRVLLFLVRLVVVSFGFLLVRFANELG
jgi:hypothetical protein